MSGIKRGSIQSYLFEFMWRKMKCVDRNDAFNKLLAAVRFHIPVEELGDEDLADFRLEMDEETLNQYDQYTI